MLNVMLVAAGVVGVGVAALFCHLQRWSVTPPLLGFPLGLALVLGAALSPTNPSRGGEYRRRHTDIGTAMDASEGSTLQPLSDTNRTIPDPWADVTDARS